MTVRYFFKTLMVILMASFMGYQAKAQASPAGIKLDEGQLALWPGSSVVSDPAAEGGNAIFRPASAGANTMWYGPYRRLQGGNYLVQARLKVSNNTSASLALTFDVYSGSAPGIYKSLNITPNMFRSSNEWQLFTFPMTLADNITDIEIRGVNFTGAADLSLDYVNILPGDARGFYSNEFTTTGTGNVGIGTSTPDQRLTVNGTIHAKQVNVDVQIPGPDYVFEKNYSLKSLSALKNYLAANKHLPEVPPARTIEKSGINVTEMNLLLLKKIEELTLYLISQQEQIKNQDRKIHRLSLKLNKTAISKK